MAIKGLNRKLNESGKIKIGCKGEEKTTSGGKTMRLPVRLDHFVITTTEKGDDGGFIQDAALMNEIKGDQDAIMNANGDIIGIPIRLIYDDTELNFPTRMACYDKGILTCYGDGETAFKRLDDFTKAHACPCKKSEPEYQGNDKCKPNGKLTCVIDAAGMFGQTHVFRTTSINPVQGIIGGIELIKTATGGKIAGLPLILTVTNKSTTIPGTGQPTTVQVVSICYRGTMADLQKKCLQIASENAQFLIGMKSIEDEARKNGVLEIVSKDEERDFQEEFYPQSIIGEPVQKEPETPAKLTTDTAIDVVTGLEPEKKQEPPKQDGPVIVNSRDLLSPEDKELASKSQEKAKKDVQQLGYLNRAKTQYNCDEACRLVRRLDKEYLIRFLKDMGNDDDMPATNENKPVFLESAERLINSDDWIKIVACYIEQDEKRYGAPINHGHDTGIPETCKTETQYFHPDLIDLAKITDQTALVAAMRKRFDGRVINGTLPVPELLKLAERLIKESETPDPDKNDQEEKPGKTPHVTETTEQPKEKAAKEPEPDPDPYAWDDDGPLVEAQLKIIANLKAQLKITDPVAWGALVGNYKDATGNPLPLAAKMTAKQAEHFITSLDNDHVPF